MFPQRQAVIDVRGAISRWDFVIVLQSRYLEGDIECKKADVRTHLNIRKPWAKYDISDQFLFKSIHDWASECDHQADDTQSQIRGWNHSFSSWDRSVQICQGVTCQYVWGRVHQNTGRTERTVICVVHEQATYIRKGKPVTMRQSLAKNEILRSLSKHCYCYCYMLYSFTASIVSPVACSLT